VQLVQGRKFLQHIEPQSAERGAFFYTFGSVQVHVCIWGGMVWYSIALSMAKCSEMCGYRTRICVGFCVGVSHLSRRNRPRVYHLPSYVALMENERKIAYYAKRK